MYYDRADRDRTAETPETVETYDVDFQHQFVLGSIHQIVWGLGYRRDDSEFTNGLFPSVSFIPAHRVTNLYSAFVQDEIALRSNLHLTVGSKFEHNSFTGFEYQPDVPLLWQPRDKQTLWAAISRAVRMPALFNTDFVVDRVFDASPPSPPVLLNLSGTHDFKSEDLPAFETDYRGELMSRVTVDVAGFYNIYNRLLTTENRIPSLQFTPPPPHLLLPAQYQNMIDGEIYGVEISAKWQVTEHWRLSPGYTWFEAQMHLNPASVATLSERQAEHNNPAQQFQLLSRLDLPRDLEFDTSLYYVDALPTFGVPSYTRLDLRLGWHPIKDLEFSLVGQNLLNHEHQEFTTENRVDAAVTKIPRSFYGQVTWHF